MRTITDNKTGMTRKLYTPISDEQFEAEVAEFRHRIFQLACDIEAERKARNDLQDAKDARAGKRYDEQRQAREVGDAVAA